MVLLFTVHMSYVSIYLCSCKTRLNCQLDTDFPFVFPCGLLYKYRLGEIEPYLSMFGTVRAVNKVANRIEWYISQKKKKRKEKNGLHTHALAVLDHNAEIDYTDEPE